MRRGVRDMNCTIVLDDARAADGTRTGRLTLGERTLILTRWRLGDPGHVLFELADDPEARDWIKAVEILTRKAKPGG